MVRRLQTVHYLKYGEVVEWIIASVLKTEEALKPPWVRIPPSPPFLEHKPDSRAGTDSKSDYTYVRCGVEVLCVPPWIVNQLGVGVDWKSARSFYRE